MSTKIKSPDQLAQALETHRGRGKTVVFTNGCFDLLHVGHVRYLRQAKNLGDLLVVGINSDSSIRRLKGPARPVQPQQDRSELLAALACVDFVTLFDEDTPLTLIELLRPDILVKGADWPPERIVGKAIVEQGGGRVVTIPYVEGASTSELIKRIREGGGTGT
jgi:D-beta-D-heptose 7-phosphate kinase/D-beta-D-heptose 1-phosphate adenosyltransferase